MIVRFISCCAGWLVLLATVLLGSSLSCPACTVPVFRYGLEFWPPDPYKVYVFHQGPLSDHHASLVWQLSDTAKGATTPANFRLFTVDVSKNIEDPQLQSAWDAHKERARQRNTFPWFAIHFPHRARAVSYVARGPLTLRTTNLLLVSPVRNELAKRLGKGESAVWLFLESGHPENDEAAYAKLSAELNRLQQQLTLPPLSRDEDTRYVSISDRALKVAFSIIRLSRKDPQELILIRMLLRSQTELPPSRLKQPLAVPVFGRGRALTVLPADEFSAHILEDVCSYILGPCGCEVRQQNPGTDLLMTVDWEGIASGSLRPEQALSRMKILPASDKQPTPEPAAAQDVQEKVAAAGISPANPTGAAPDPTLQNLAIAIGVCLCVFLGMSAALTFQAATRVGEAPRRTKKRRSGN